MKLTAYSRDILKHRRHARKMRKAGYQMAEVDPLLHRGWKWRHIITDIQVSLDGKHVWFKTEERKDTAHE